jgi:predicted phosphodiesterase
LKPDFVVICGDLVHTFDDKSITDFKRIKAGLTMPSYCAPGNHDVGNTPTVASLNRYREAIGDDYYSFEHNGYTFVIANTQLWKAPLAGESEAHDSWFKQTLEAARENNSPIFIVGHYPLYLETPNENEGNANLPLQKRNELLVLFEECGVVAVLAGHTHTTIVNDYKGIQLVNGETTSTPPLGFRLWHVGSPISITHEFIPLAPGADFNRDKKVDLEDLGKLAQYWLQDEPSVDIAPGPYGDEMVDFKDLAVFAKYWLKDFRLLAHWRLDETEGSVAQDSAGANDGTLHGDPTWQPASGKINGALQLDSTDDYVSTPYILDPAGEPFSVLVWIKGGAPGQVILSQESGVNWLAADAVDGALKTDLRTPEKTGRSPIPKGPPLICPTVVTDGDWHRVGFVRDGSDRILYVDDIEVARDTATNLESASGGLYIGAGSDLEPSSFWSGLIDDVRIYNQAVTP